MVRNAKLLLLSASALAVLGVAALPGCGSDTSTGSATAGTGGAGAAHAGASGAAHAGASSGGTGGAGGAHSDAGSAGASDAGSAGASDAGSAGASDAGSAGVSNGGVSGGGSAGVSGGGSAGASTGGASGSGGACTIDPKQLGFGVTEISAQAPYVQGIAVEAVACGTVPGNEETTGQGSGYLHPPHPTVPFYYKLTKAGYTPSLTMDATAPATSGGTFQKGVILTPTSTSADFFPGFNGTTASLIIHFSTNSVPCFTGGWTVAITGHPEAQISYYTKPPYSGGTPTLAAAPASAVLFYIAVTKLTPGAPATMPLVVSGVTGGTCSLQLKGSVSNDASIFADGKIPLEAGAITNAVAMSD